MLTEEHPRLTYRAPGSSVELAVEGPHLARIDVKAEEGLHAAHAAARLVREAVLEAASRGVNEAQLSLDVSSPVCGTVLDELSQLAGEGLAAPRMRRAGGTVLVDLVLTGPSSNRDPVAPSGRAVMLHARRPRPRGFAPEPPGLAEARRAQARLRVQLDGRDGVCGVGLAQQGNRYVLRVNLVHPGIEVPSRVDGIPVEVRVTGAVMARTYRGRTG